VYILAFLLPFSSAVFVSTFTPSNQAQSASATFDVGVVVEGCNSNLVCEPANGETVANCPSDCTNFQCSNGIDDDGDGFIDYPNDPHCDSALDDREKSDGGGGGGGSDDAKCKLSVLPDTISVGENSYVIWESVGASLLREINPNIGSVAQTGSVLVSPAQTTTYVGTFTGLKNTASCTATLTVEVATTTQGVVQFESPSYTVSENDGSITLGVQRVVGVDGDITVTVTTAEGSADSRDFDATTQVLTWLDGESDIKLFTVPINRDVFQESDEVFTVEITAVDPGVLGNPVIVPVTIVDPTVIQDDTTLTLIKTVENDDGGALESGDFILTVNGSQVQSGAGVIVASNTALTINEIQQSGYELTSVSGTAGCPATLPGEITLQSGEDAICRIVNDDIATEPRPGVVRFPTNSITVGEGGRLQFFVSRQGGSDGEIDVLIRSYSGTALPGQDYEDFAERLVWADGESGPKRAILRTFDDNLIEGDESLTLVLDSGTAVRAQPDRMTVVILDNDQPDDSCVGPDCYIVIPVVTPPGGGVSAPIIDVLDILQGLYEIPGFQNMARISSGLGVIGGLGSLLTIGFGLQNLWLSLLRLISFLLSIIGLRRRARPWGTVFDSVTKQPLDPAYVSLLDEDGKEVKGVITDLDGRYGFLVEPGRYRITVMKTNYIFPSKRLAGQTEDELYDHLYFGDWLEIKEEGEVIAKNIPMDPEKFDWNEFAKRDMKVMKYYRRRDLWIARITQFFFILGLIFSFFSFLYFPHPYNYIVFLVYNGMLFFSLLGLKRKRSGVITDSETGDPLSFAVIRIFAPESGNEVGHAVTDAAGRYYKLIANGVYKIRVEKKVSEEHFEPVFESEKVRVKRGILNKNFQIKIAKKPL